MTKEDYEKSDWSPRWPLGVLLGTAAVILLAFPVSWGVWGFVAEDRTVVKSMAGPLRQILPTLPDEPRLQKSPKKDWNQYKQSQLNKLTSYGWKNEAKDVVRIPIERAMQLEVDDGFTRHGSEKPPKDKRGPGHTPAQNKGGNQ